MAKKAPLQMTWSKKEQDWLFHHDRRKSDGGMLYGFMRGGMRAVAELHPDWPIPFEKRIRIGLGKEPEPYISDDLVFRLFRDELQRRGFDPDTFKITCQRLPEPTAEEETKTSHK